MGSLFEAENSEPLTNINPLYLSREITERMKAEMEEDEKRKKEERVSGLAFVQIPLTAEEEERNREWNLRHDTEIDTSERLTEETTSIASPASTRILGEVESELGKEPITSGRFRLQNKTVHLTYPSHIADVEAFKTFIETVTKKSLKQWSIVNETGQTNHQHCHALLDFDSMFSTTNCRIFDYMDEHPNIKKVTSKIHVINIARYHTKQGIPNTNMDLRAMAAEKISGPKAPSPQEIWAHKKPTDMIVALYPRVPGVRAGVFVHGMRPRDRGSEPAITWRPWQRILLEELNQEPDDRTITWYWDPKGNTGKTYITKFLTQHRGAFVVTRANAYHLATILQQFIEENGEDAVATVIFNFARQCEEHKVYQAIEQLKDGLITSEKFKGKTMCFKSPHVVVMANYLPMFEACSLDRWKIRMIEGDEIKHEFTEEYLRSAASTMIGEAAAAFVSPLTALRLKLDNHYSKEHAIRTRQDVRIV